MTSVRVVLLSCMAATALVAAQSVKKPATVESVEAHIYRPALVEPSDALIQRLKLPPGFRVSRYADGLEGPRMLAVHGDGGVYVTRPKQGDVVLLRDGNDDGVADDPPRIVARQPEVHGIALHKGMAYLATVHEVFVADVQPDGSLGSLRAIVRNLPDGGQHANRTLGIGPDGQLYISVGSLANAFPTPANDETAALLRTALDGSGRGVYARGLRNTIGFAWHPETGELWGMDHGIDWMGDDRPPEELNRIGARGALWMAVRVGRPASPHPRASRRAI